LVFAARAPEAISQPNAQRRLREKCIDLDQSVGSHFSLGLVCFWHKGESLGTATTSTAICRIGDAPSASLPCPGLVFTRPRPLPVVVDVRKLQRSIYLHAVCSGRDILAIDSTACGRGDRIARRRCEMATHLQTGAQIKSGDDLTRQQKNNADVATNVMPITTPRNPRSFDLRVRWQGRPHL
jgi:hypothetical protein